MNKPEDKNEKYLRQEIWPKLKKVFYYCVAFSLAMNVLMLVLPFFSMLVFDKVLTSHSMETLFMLGLIATFCFVVLSTFNAFRGFVLSRMSDWMDASLSPQLMEISVTNSAISPASTGSQLLRDLGSLKAFITGPAMITALDAPWCPIFILVTFMIHPVMGLVTLKGAVILIFFAVLNEVQTKKIFEQNSKDTIRTLMNAEAITRSAEAIEAMGMMKNVVSKWASRNLQMITTQRVATDRATLIGSISKFFRLIVQIELICVGAYYSIHHSLSIGAMIAGPILAGRALAPFEAAIGIWKQVVQTRDAYTRINKSIAMNRDLRGQMELPEPKGRIIVEGAYYRPPKTERMILNNVRFALEPGECLGIIGPSAAGKSTLAKLLVGVWQPIGGTVRLDGNDIFRWNRADVGRYIGYMPQSVELFNATIKENICRLDPDAGSEEVVQAAMKAGVHDMIIRLPKGYDTVFEQGVLSPGQQQRVALARAFYGNPKLMVLDEPNSNLDGEGELALIEAINQAKKNIITTIVIAHKPTLLGGVDKLLVLREGSVDLFGPRDAVLAKLAERNQQQQPAKVIQQKPQAAAGGGA